MTHRSSPNAQLATAGLLLALIAAAACESRQPTAPDDMEIRAAKPPKDGGEIMVDSADPPEGEQGAVGLQIRVLGSGFEKGAKVAFHLPGQTDPDAGMTVQSTQFVTSTEVIATTDIALDAVVDSRDISVSFRGRRGIGTEVFHVKLHGNPNEPQVDATVTDPATGAGVYSDGSGLAVYGPEDGTTSRVRLEPRCASPRRDLVLVLPQGTGLSQDDVPTCNGDGEPDAGWMYLQLPDVLDTTCGSYPCIFGAQQPAYEQKGRKKKPTGGFGPTVHFFWQCGDGPPSESLCNFVFRNAQLSLDGATGERRVTAALADLYVGQDFEVKWSGALELDVTVKERTP